MRRRHDLNRSRSSILRRCACIAVALCANAFAPPALTQEGPAVENSSAAASGSVLRVCADPDNLPQSNQRGEGYENKIAEALAKDLGRDLKYTWFPQRIGFVRNTLRSRDEGTQEYKCDVIIGVPTGYELTITTRPYMRSTYALIFADGKGLEKLHTADDVLKAPPEILRALRFGVFTRSPGADWLLRNGLIEQAEVYQAQSGDPAEHPALTIERDLSAKKIDAAIVWGPVAGFLIREHAAHNWRAVPFMPDRQIKFDYEISMGVRRGEQDWQAVLDRWIDEHQSTIRTILASYRIPLLDADGGVIADFDDDHASIMNSGQRTADSGQRIVRSADARIGIN